MANDKSKGRTPSAALMYEMKVRVLLSQYDWLTDRSREQGVSLAAALRQCVAQAMETGDGNQATTGKPG